MERAASIWLGLCVEGHTVWGGEAAFPLWDCRVPGNVKAPQVRQGLGLRSRGACEPGRRVAYIAHPPTEGPEFNVSSNSPAPSKGRLLFLFVPVFGIVYASQMICKGNFVHSTNFYFKGGRLEKGLRAHSMPAIVLFVHLDEQWPQMAGD